MLRRLRLSYWRVWHLMFGHGAKFEADMRGFYAVHPNAVGAWQWCTRCGAGERIPKEQNNG